MFILRIRGTCPCDPCLTAGHHCRPLHLPHAFCHQGQLIWTRECHSRVERPVLQVSSSTNANSYLFHIVGFIVDSANYICSRVVPSAIIVAPYRTNLLIIIKPNRHLVHCRVFINLRDVFHILILVDQRLYILYFGSAKYAQLGMQRISCTHPTFLLKLHNFLI